jgi:cell filamentation protein, protein adenylyltransferase
VATIVRRTVKGATYYYLEHTIRDKDRFSQKSKYLGKAIPKDIDEIKRQFVFELNRERWFDAFDRIKKNYRATLRTYPESARRKELQTFSVRFTYDTQRIEGSTLSLKETAQLLEEGISPGGKPVEDIKEAEAHQKVFFEMLKCTKDLSLQLVLVWHWELFKDTKPDIAGQIRKHGVGITGSRYVPASPVELQPMLADFFRWHDREKTRTHPVELAALVHLKFVTIHPFADGNGRISRMMMNFALHKSGYPMLNIEYKNRGAYYNALERSQLNKEERVFTNWFFRRYLRELKRYS